MDEWYRHADPDRRVLDAIHSLDRKVDRLMASVEEVTAALETLTTDLEALAATAKAEFTHLEEEVAAGTPPNLDPLKASIEALDTRVKSAEVPSA